jgi:ribonuclease HI
MTSSIFCDGACSGNGTARSRGGWAWAWWPAGPVAGDPVVARAEPLETPPTATNQRAELTALLEALRWWATPVAGSGGGGGPVTVYSDSQYAINCASVWGPSWARRGWRRGTGEPIQNLDLIQPLVALWRPEWRLVHVRGHQTGTGPLVWGNNWVDRAAVSGAAETPVVIDRRSLTAVSRAAAAPAPSHVTAIPFAVAGAGAAPAPAPAPTIQRVGKQADIRWWFS